MFRLPSCVPATGKFPLRRLFFHHSRSREKMMLAQKASGWPVKQKAPNSRRVMGEQ
jgi:hypothetical protein